MTELVGPPIEAMGSDPDKSDGLLAKPLSDEMAKTGFGHILKGAHKRKRKSKKIKKSSEGEVPANDSIDIAAEKLANASTKVEVLPSNEGELVKIHLDPSKMNRGDLGKIFPQTMLRASVIKDIPSGGVEISDSRTIFRHVVGGRVLFLIPGPNGEPIEYELPKNGTLLIDIPPRYQDGKGPKEVLALLKTKLVKGTHGQIVDHGTNVAMGLLKPKAPGIAPIPTPRSGGPGSVPNIAPIPTPLASTKYPSSSPSFAPLPNPFSVGSLPEVVKGDLKISEKVIPANESPTGMKLYISHSETLKDKKPVRIVTVLPGDGNYIKSTSRVGGTVQSNVEKMRRAGENVVLVIPEPKRGTKANRWDYFHDKTGGKSTFDKLATSLKDVYGDSELSLIAYSGGYRAVRSILQSAEDPKMISHISLMDSSYTKKKFASTLASWVAAGGKLFSRVSNSKDGHGRDTARGHGSFVKQLAKHDNVLGSVDFQQMRTGYGGTVKGNMLNALAFSSGMSGADVVSKANRPRVAVEMTPNKQVDALFSTTLLSYLSCAPKKNMRKGKCNYYSRDMMNYIYTKVLSMSKPIFENVDGRGSNYIANAPMASRSTADVRGVRVRSLTEGHFANFRPGQVIHMNAANKFQGQNAATPGTSHKLSASNKFQRTTKGEPWRHWVTVVSTSPLRFTDNRMRLYDLGDFKQRYGGRDRIMVNVYDPLAGVRQNMVASNGQLNFNGRRLA
ncbi:hypothetical protein JKY72_02510 [Candidatus Gracilibacteria bacterium]|nr:hypothetical protein [Candidatus Gracilibacteria bacterium]